jgi:type VI secretion system protein ImpB
MAESLQHTLDRVRAPRVQITYDVEVGDAIEMKEIPFVSVCWPICPENLMTPYPR